jgi:GntR family transcriptional regulator / MocR family aminotransferase
MNLSTITRAFGNCTENGLAKNQKFSVFLQVLVELIDSGMLPEDSNLPPTRTLSQAIGLSRATVAKAYEHLLFLGKVQSRQGSRVWVAPISFRSAETRTATAKTEEPQLSDLGRAFLAQSPEVRSTESSVHPLQPGVPPLDLFPVNQWRSLTNDYWRNVRISGLTYSSTAGQQVLKQTLSQLLFSERGIRCEPDQIAVVSGSVQSLFLVGSLLLNPGDSVALENPTFPNVQRIFSGLRAQKIELKSEPGHALGTARLAHVATSEAYPVGPALSIERRAELADQLAAQGGYLIENDYEHSVGQPSSNSLLAQDQYRSNIIYLSTFNRVLHPSIRIGFMVLPHELVRPMHALMGQSHRFVSTSAQTVLHEFIQAGHWQQHAKHLQRAITARKAALHEAVRLHFPSDWVLQSADRAQHACLIPPSGTSIPDRLRARFIQQGVHPHFLEDHYWTGSPQCGLVLGTGSVHESQMNHWVGVLSEQLPTKTAAKLDYKK